jgi:hypothetical protein
VGRSDLKRRVAEETVRVLVHGERPLHCVNLGSGFDFSAIRVAAP